jgi:UDP:flavonoid glycosyltransferase YjiC (YdhE family)
MRALLIPIGSYGDVNPFIGLGRALRARGHEVLVATNEHFEPLLRQAGLEFISLGTQAEYDACLKDPNAWHPRKGFAVIARYMEPMLRRVYDAIVKHYRRGETIVAAGTLAFGARIAQERLGYAMATIHLQPVMFRSGFQAPVLPSFPMYDWMPTWWKHSLFWLADHLVVDRVYGPPINALRKEVGLPPVRRLFDGWFHSPQRIIGLFPEWFAPLQPDWPAQLRLTSFPRHDGRLDEDLPADVRAFLDAGEPPLVFTPGSAMAQGRRFFEQSLHACRLLGRRAMFVTQYLENIPERLPDNVRHFHYVPFGRLLPHAAAMIHHGGIGTSSQALAAGVPQLVMPFTHDQPDNAARLRRLGVARQLPAAKYRGPVAARLLDELLRSPAVARHCKVQSERLAREDPWEETCRLLEELTGAEFQQSPDNTE